MTTHTGGCVCGAVRYELASDPLFVVNCHCKDCQRSSGTDGAVVMGVMSDGFKLTAGSPKSFTYQGDSGQSVERFFCANCGSPLFTRAAVVDNMRFVRAVSLDDTRGITPGAHIYCASAQAWTFNDLPKFDHMPPSA